MSSDIISEDDFPKNPKGEHEKWRAELDAFKTASKQWHKRGQDAVNQYQDERKDADMFITRLNLFYSNINTTTSMLFGKLPEITFARANTDFDDDVGRVAAMILQRMLQNDIGTPNDEYSDTLRACLWDRLTPGLGTARVRYEVKTKTTETESEFDINGNVTVEGSVTETIESEKAPIEYEYWKDTAWSPARTWPEVRWVAFRVLLTRDECEERFGEKLGKQIPLTESFAPEDATPEQKEHEDAWKRAEIWEIWDKTTRKVLWWNKGVERILDEKDDTLKLAGFFPIPKPWVANPTTSAFMPVPDYYMAKDLYQEINALETRISLITDAVKVVGLYDQSNADIGRMMTEGVENDMIPVDNWSMMAEKGGLQGQIEWFPVAEVASVLDKLVQRRNDVKAQLFEITGMSDIMRGAQAAGAVSATERALEARFASVRIQALQDEFANYATDLIRLRAEIISKHFDPEQIAEQSNIQYTPDFKQNPKLVMQAIQLIKDRPDLVWRIQVKPESVAMVDYAQLQNERTAYLTGVATYIQSMGAIVTERPELEPVLLGMLQWGLAGFKGSEDVEGLLDNAIKQAKAKPPEQQGEDDGSQAALQLEQVKGQNASQLEQQKTQGKLTVIQAEAQTRQQELQGETQQIVAKEAAQLEANKNEESHETDEYKERKDYDVVTARRMPRDTPQE